MIAVRPYKIRIPTIPIPKPLISQAYKGCRVHPVHPTNQPIKYPKPHLSCTNLYLGTIFGNPKDIYVCGQFVSGRISLDKKFPYDFIILKWDTIVLSLIDLDLPMPTTLQISNWQKSKIRRMFDSSNSYFRIVAHNPNTLKVRAITGAYNLYDEVLEDDTEEFQDAPQPDQPDQPDQPTAVNQPTFEVVVTDQQCTMTFNGEQVHICEEVILSNPNPNPQA